MVMPAAKTSKYLKRPLNLFSVKLLFVLEIFVALVLVGASIPTAHLNHALNPLELHPILISERNGQSPANWPRYHALQEARDQRQQQQQNHSRYRELHNYNPIAAPQDYVDRSNVDQGHPSEPGSSSTQPQAAGAHNAANDEQRINPSPGDYQAPTSDPNSYESNSGAQGSGSSLKSANGQGHFDQLSNSRSSIQDVYLKPEPKTGESGNSQQLRNSLDPFEDMTTEYERDLADLDEEFSKHAFRSRPTASLMSDSFMTLSPERYEPQGSRRPSSYREYLNTAGSISGIIPRSYTRNPWASADAYADSSDLWPESSIDYNPLASLMSPSLYRYQERPRYQRISPYLQANPPYLAASASGQHLYTSAAMPTESISFTLSPLAAAAAAAATALAAADKSRHQNHAWLTLPRLASTLTSPATSGVSPAASSSAPLVIPSALQHTYIQRPSPYLLSSMPAIYAYSPRPSTSAPLTNAASGSSIIPYFHHGAAAPAIFAYRPTGAVLPSPSMLTAASFAYPLRFPMAPVMQRPTSTYAIGPTRFTSGVGSGAGGGTRGDLQFAETKPKSNLNGGSSSSSSSSSSSPDSVKVGSLSAIARNLTRKMFGSASQIRPQHVAPPANYQEANVPAVLSPSFRASGSPLPA